MHFLNSMIIDPLFTGHSPPLRPGGRRSMGEIGWGSGECDGEHFGIVLIISDHFFLSICHGQYEQVLPKEVFSRFISGENSKCVIHYVIKKELSSESHRQRCLEADVWTLHGVRQCDRAAVPAADAGCKIFPINTVILWSCVKRFDIFRTVCSVFCCFYPMKIGFYILAGQSTHGWSSHHASGAFPFH